MGRELHSENEAFQWEGNLTAGKRFTVGREHPSRKEVSQWKKSFLVEKELTSGEAKGSS